MKQDNDLKQPKIIVFRKKRWIKNFLLCLVLFVSVAAISFCINYKRTVEVDKQQEDEETLKQIEQENAAVKATASPVKTNEDTNTSKPVQSPKKTDEQTAESQNIADEKVVVIDPGHQQKQNKEQEAIAPGSEQTKKKVTSGTQGRFTNVPEYEVNLLVSLKLRDVLEAAGCTVIMTRETNEVDISNIERAKIANEAEADAFVRIHCNGSEDASVNGILTICPTKDNTYCKEIYEDCYELSEDVLSSLIKATGAKDKGITMTDTMSGINWSKVPVTIVEMGYMTNEKEDRLLVSEEYQNKLVDGLAEGILTYLDKKS